MEWNHSNPETQSAFIDSLILQEKTYNEIVSIFSDEYPGHKTPEARVRKHIRHLVKDHKDFPYTFDGNNLYTF